MALKKLMFHQEETTAGACRDLTVPGSEQLWGMFNQSFPDKLIPGGVLSPSGIKDLKKEKVA